MKAGLLKSAAYPKYKGHGAFCGIVLQFKAVLSQFLSRPSLVSLLMVRLFISQFSSTFLAPGGCKAIEV